MSDIAKVHDHIKSVRDRNFDTWVKLVAQPSVSAQNMGVEECVQMLREIMSDCSVESEVCQTSGQPIVYGEIRSNKPDAKTLIFYGHYDTQPPEPYEAWDSPPFEPTIRNGRLYGRGTSDNKGQLLAHLFAVRSFIETRGEVPVNIKFILDGEEESGSPTMGEFIEKFRDKLKGDLIFNADGGMDPSGRPIVFFGVRGMLNVEMTLQTNTKDNHSGHTGGVINNACWELVRFLNTMIDEDRRCRVKGFYDAVTPPSAYDLKLIDDLEYDPKIFQKLWGALEEIQLDKKSFYTRIMFQPSFTINGIYGGYGGPGGKTIVPGSAGVKIDMRLVDEQDPDDIFKKLQAHIDEFDSRVKLKMLSKQRPSRTKTDLPVCVTVVEAMEKAYNLKPIIKPLVGATNPESYFTKDLGLPSVTTAYANADQSNHAPNENFDIELFHQGIHCSAEIIEALGNL